MLNNLSTLINVELAIFGEIFNPEELTKQFNLEPTMTYKKVSLLEVIRYLFGKKQTGVLKQGMKNLLMQKRL